MDEQLHTASTVAEPREHEAVDGPQETAEKASSEGVERLDRSWPSLLATGVVGGVDVSVGVIALVLLIARTGDEVIASIGFSLGFVALALARSELITENFLVPVATVTDGKRPLRSLLRLWSGTLLANLAGGFVLMGVFTLGWPDAMPVAAEIGMRSEPGVLTTQTFARALVAGGLITLMTWMQQGVRQSVGGRVIAAASIGFLIIYSHSNHVVVGSFEVALGIMGGHAEYGWVDLLVSIPWWLAGNLVGGLLLVTVVRLVQARS